MRLTDSIGDLFAKGCIMTYDCVCGARLCMYVVRKEITGVKRSSDKHFQESCEKRSMKVCSTDLLLKAGLKANNDYSITVCTVFVSEQ